MAEGKWITDLSAATPLLEAARRVLALRLQVVHDILPLALHHWQEEAEHVHQLRVSTRRAGAAVSIFECCMPGKVHRKIRQYLRRVRRAAGAARDWDVFAEELSLREQQASAAQRPGLDFLIGYCQGQRVAAQQLLVDAGPQAPFVQEGMVDGTVANLRAPSPDAPARNLGAAARLQLLSLLGNLQLAFEGDLTHYEHLHQVRILGKRLRYAMEVFASCFASPFRDTYYPMIEEMQEILGRANDSHVAGQRMTCLRTMLKTGHPEEWKRFKSAIEGLLRYHQRRLPVQRRMFEQWRQRWQNASAGAGLTKMVSAAL